jgi:dsDNA-binding SOS-regulon protein
MPQHKPLVAIIISGEHPTGKKKRGRPPADPAAKAAAALKKKQDAHNKAIDDWDAAFEKRQRFLDAGIGDEFAGWERDLERMREEQSKLDALSDEFDAKGEDIKEGYQLPSREWCEWIDNLEAYMKKRNNDEDMLVHEKEETEWFDKMHPQREALDTFYPAEEDEEGEEDEEDEAAPMAATSNQQLRKRMKKRQRRGEK